MFLSAYLAKYEGNSKWYFTATSFGPAVLFWILRLFLKELYLGHLFRIWGLYIVALVINMAMVFGFVGDRIDKTEFLGPNVLKVILCITPPLLLLLLNTGDLDDSDKNDKERELVSKLCFPMAIDLFDGIEMIDIVLEEREYDIGIPKAFSASMILLACLSMLLSPWQMAENELAEEGPKIRLPVAFYRNIAQIVCVNLPFLVIRAVVFFMFGKDESIFIAKNAIAIVLSILEIRKISRLQRVEQENQVV